MEWHNWIRNHELLTGVVVGLSAALSIGGIVAVPIIVTYLPADYFVDNSHATANWRRRHPAIRWSLWTIKNALGFALVVIGIVMLFAPGPGLVSILVGLSLMSFPGKRALERRVVGVPGVRRQINALRARAGQPPLELPPNL